MNAQGRPCLALVPGERFHEELRPVIDTGERDARVIQVRKYGYTCIQELGLVIVPGEPEPRWLAVERIEPADPRQQGRWHSRMRVELQDRSWKR